MWMLAALAASALLVAVLIWQHRNARTQWASFVAGSPHAGARLFEKKGCLHCHAVNGWGGRLAPDLGSQRPPRSGLNELVSAMWNCAPRMWDQIRVQKRPYPLLDQEEMTHIFAFLYTARYIDEPGDAALGEPLFRTKGCPRCHAVRGAGGKIGPDLATAGGFDTPIVWTQAMWNHAPHMEAEMAQRGIAWPTFEGTEMNDLLAYMRQVSTGPRRESELLPADPRRGWDLFQSKSCIQCHAVRSRGGTLGPELGPRRQVPPTLVQFAGLMWNHFPKMWQAMQAQKIKRPTFQGREMADLIAFLYSLRYFEPVGSSQAGEHFFYKQHCSECHGPRGEGSKKGPSLRRRKETFTSLELATGLWRHGPKMNERLRESGLKWPTLVERDVSDLVAFLNTPASDGR